MSNRFEQESRLHGVATSFEIDPTDVVELAEQTFFLFSEREAKRISSECFKRYAWFPVQIISDVRFPAVKGMQWIATELFPSVNDVMAVEIIYGMRPFGDIENVREVVEFLDGRPDLITTGQAQRGLDQLKRILNDA